MTEEKKNNVIDEIEEFEEDVIIELEFEDGESEECKLVCIFEEGDDENSKLYAVLDPMDGKNEYYFFNYEEIGDDQYQLSDIETEEEFNRISEAFFELAEAEEE